MVKHIQTICRQPPTNCLSVFDHFVRLALEGLRFLEITVTIVLKKKSSWIVSVHKSSLLKQVRRLQKHFQRNCVTCNLSSKLPRKYIPRILTSDIHLFSRVPLFQDTSPWMLSFLFILDPERRSGVSIIKFEHISHLFLVFLLFTVNK